MPHLCCFAASLLLLRAYCRHCVLVRRLAIIVASLANLPRWLPRWCGTIAGLLLRWQADGAQVVRPIPGRYRSRVVLQVLRDGLQRGAKEPPAHDGHELDGVAPGCHACWVSETLKILTIRVRKLQDARFNELYAPVQQSVQRAVKGSSSSSSFGTDHSNTTPRLFSSLRCRMSLQ